jgi:hypothetical protein
MKATSLIGKAFRYADRDCLLVKMLIVLALFSLRPEPSALSQIPQGFTYQALAFDSSGEPIRNTALPVRISIESDSLGGTLFWQELHSSVTTNGSGLFSLVLGKGVKQSGDALTFADIDWSVTPKFIRTEIDYGGWKTMGASRLWSVPYAMRSAGLTGSLANITVTGENRIGNHLLGGTNIEVNNYGTGNRYAFIDFHGDDAYSDYGLRIVRNNTGQDALSRIMHRGLGSLDIYTHEAAPVDLYTSAVMRMRIAANGRVGIGITAPGYQLDVNGEIASRTANAFRLRQTGYSTILRNDNTNFYILLTNSGDPDGTWNTIRPFNINLASGNVGIGVQNNNSKLVVQAPASWNDETPLFEVKNKNGVPVFTVYNYGVRVLVDHTYSKAVKGGFAIGGFDETKAGETVTLMMVTPDSIRFNINNSESKAVKGGFAIGGFDETKGPINEDFMYLTPKGSTAGLTNVRIGFEAGKNAKGMNNTHIGFNAGYSLAGSNAAANIFIGDQAGRNNTGGYTLVSFMGQNVIQSFGGNNVAIGYFSGKDIRGASFPQGNNNVLLGNYSGYGLTTGNSNVNLGSYSGFSNLTGTGNVLAGNAAGYNLTSSSNVFIGTSAGYNTTSGGGNVFIGNRAGHNETGSNKLYIANSSTSTPLIYGDFNAGLLKINGNLQLSADLGINQIIHFPDPARSLNIGGTGEMISPYAIHLVTAGAGNLGVARISLVGDGVGIGTTEPGHKLDVRLTTTNGFVASVSNNGNTAGSHGMRIIAGSETSSGATFIRFEKGVYGASSTIGSIYQNAASTIAYATSSDERVKRDITPSVLGLTDLMKIGVYDFIFCDDITNTKQTGFVAQQLYDIFPGAVVKPENQEELWMVDYSKVTPLLARAVQQQQSIIEMQSERIDQQQSELESLKGLAGEVQSLKSEIEALKAMIMSGNK